MLTLLYREISVKLGEYILYEIENDSSLDENF